MATWCKSGVSQESGTAPRPRRSLGGFIGSGGAVPLEGLVKGAVARRRPRPRDEGSLLRTMALSQTKCTRMVPRISCTYHSGNAPAFLKRAPEVADDAVTSVGQSARGRVSQLKGQIQSISALCCCRVRWWCLLSFRKVVAATDAMIDNEQANWSRKPKHTTFGQPGAHGNSKPPPLRAFTFARWVGSVSGRFLFVTTLRLVITASYLSCPKILTPRTLSYYLSFQLHYFLGGRSFDGRSAGGCIVGFFFLLIADVVGAFHQSGRKGVFGTSSSCP